MLSVGNVGQNNYNTSFGCKGNAKKLVGQLGKKSIMSPERFDKIALTDPVANAAQKLKAGLGSKEELREVIMREEALKVGKDGIIKTILKSFKK